MKNELFITGKLFTTAILAFLFQHVVVAQSDEVRPVHIGLIYPISSNGVKAATYTNRFSLHAIAGLSKSETALAVSGMANIIKEDANGVQLAGAINLIGDSAKGAQVAGFANIVRNEADGAQIAGFLNLAGSTKGVQIAGFSNITRKNANGVQIAGFLNKGEDVNGQVSGFINKARNVKGVQLAGFINIADSSDYSIGVFNFIKNGERSIGVTFDETQTGMLSFRSGGRVLYSIIGVGYNFKSSNKALYAVEAGLGAHIPVASHMRINLEAVNTTMSDFKKGTYMKGTFRVLPAIRIIDRLEIFAGPTINYVNHTEGKGNGLISHYLWSKNTDNEFKGVYFGVVGGLHFIL